MNRTKPRKKRGKLFYVLCIFGACFILGVIGNLMDPPSKSTKISKKTVTTQDALKKQFSAWDGSHYKTVRYVKKIMKNPKSFEHVQTKYNDFSGQGYRVIHMTYRGTNSFNAIVTNTISVKVNLQGDVLSILSQN